MIETSLAVFKTRLNNFVKKLPGKPTGLSDVTKKMVGDNAARKLKIKGGEAYSVLLFIEHELKKFRTIPKQKLYVKGVGALVQLNKVFRDAGWSMDVGERREAHDCYNQYIDAAVALDLVLPKTHLGAHLLSDLDWFGNPRFYAAWADEGWNRVLKQCARGLSQATFDVCILAGVNQQLKQDHLKRLESKRPRPLKP